MKKSLNKKNNLRIAYATIIVSLLCLSCLEESDVDIVQRAAVLNAEVPDTLVTQETYNIPLTYDKITNCHEFSDFNIVERADDVLVTINTKLQDEGDCNVTDINEGQVDLEYSVERQSDFTFRFFQEVQNNEVIYLNRDVVVVESE